MADVSDNIVDQIRSSFESISEAIYASQAVTRAQAELLQNVDAHDAKELARILNNMKKRLRGVTKDAGDSTHKKLLVRDEGFDIMFGNSLFNLFNFNLIV